MGTAGGLEMQKGEKIIRESGVGGLMAALSPQVPSSAAFVWCTCWANPDQHSTLSPTSGVGTSACITEQVPRKIHGHTHAQEDSLQTHHLPINYCIIIWIITTCTVITVLKLIYVHWSPHLGCELHENSSYLDGPFLTQDIAPLRIQRRSSLQIDWINTHTGINALPNDAWVREQMHLHFANTETKVQWGHVSGQKSKR